MNLIELNIYKKKLKFGRYLCFAMTFFSLMNLTRTLDKNINKSDNSDNIGYEWFSEYKNLTALESNPIAAITSDYTDSLKRYVKDVALSKAPLLEEARQLTIIEPAEPTYEEKMQAIMEREGYTYDQLDAVCAGCVAESYGDGNCYDECYRIANIFYNRTHDVAYVNDVNKAFGENAGYSIYYQFAAPNQFSVFIHESYKKYLGRIDLLGYQGAIDMLYSGITVHDFLNFNNVPPKSGEYIQFNPPSGNYFYRHQRPENVIDNELANELVLSLNRS